jgi:hypothetical protein
MLEDTGTGLSKLLVAPDVMLYRTLHQILQPLLSDEGAKTQTNQRTTSERHSDKPLVHHKCRLLIGIVNFTEKSKAIH